MLFLLPLLVRCTCFHVRVCLCVCVYVQTQYAWKTVQVARENVAAEEDKLAKDITVQTQAQSKLEELRAVRSRFVPASTLV